MALEMNFFCPQILFYTSLFIMFATSVGGQSLTPFTYRYNEYITSEYVKNCSIKCQCDETNDDNLCACTIDGVDTFPIEAPYAAIMMSIDCYPRNIKDQEWSPTKLTVGYKTSRKEEYDFNIRGKEGILKQLKSMPRIDFNIELYYMYKDTVEKVSRTSFKTVSKGQRTVSKVYIMIPGFASGFGQLFDAFKDAIFNHCSPDECGLIIVDWRFGNQFYLDNFEMEHIYEDAAKNSVYVGYYIAEYLFDAKVMKTFDGDATYHILAFDLGSEVAHYVAKRYNKIIFQEEDYRHARIIDRISAFDPVIYLFEDEHLNMDDAKYVDIYHSNPMRRSKYTSIDIFDVENDIELRIENEKLRKRELISNLKERRFGDPRRRGHSDFYINIDADTFNINHGQCKEAPMSAPFWGCHSSMASRVYLDTIIKMGRTEFKVMSKGPDDSGYGEAMDMDILYGWNADTNDPDKYGEYHVTYNMDMCTIKDKKNLGFTPILTADEKDKLIGPKQKLASKREKIFGANFPLEEPDLISKSKKETYQNCGQYSLDTNVKRDARYVDARIWEGNQIVSKNMFPWTVCIKDYPIYIRKYYEIVVDNERYRRPDSMMYDLRYHWTERLSSLVANGHYHDPQEPPGQSCSGSLISEEYILTAAHCFEGYINEMDIIVNIGEPDCGYFATDGYRIKIEMDKSSVDRTIFVPDDWTSGLDEMFNEWIDNNLGLLTADDEENVDRADDDDYKDFEDFTGHQMRVRLSGHEEPCPTEAKMRTVYRPTDIMDTGADIGLIRIPMKFRKDIVKERPLKMCFMSASSINVDQFNQYIYIASYGSKGFDVPNGGNPHGHASLTWLSFRTINYIKRQLIDDPNFNMSHVRVYGGQNNAKNYFHLVNTDFDENGHLITSSTCGGDSGGPLFVYGQRADGTKFAIQIGVLSGSDSGGAPGGFPIVRADKVDGCAKEFKYNVFMKKFLGYPQRITNLKYWLEWIQGIVDGQEFVQDKKLKTSP